MWFVRHISQVAFQVLHAVLEFMLLMFEIEEEGSLGLMLCNIHFSSNSIQLPIHQFQSLSIGMPGMFSLHGKGEGAEADKPQDMLRQTDTLPLLQALCFRHFVLDKLSNLTKPELPTLLLTLCPL